MQHKCEVGFIHLNATIMAKGLLDSKVPDCPSYQKEKEMVASLLTARYDIEDIDEGSRNLIAGLIKERLERWWKDSRYNVQVCEVRTDVINHTKSVLTARGARIIISGSQNMLVTGLSDWDFCGASRDIEFKYPGLISYRQDITGEMNELPMPKF